MEYLGLLLSAIAIGLFLRCAYVLRELRRDFFGLADRFNVFESSERLTPDKLAELAQVSDAVKKGNDLLKRVNSREVMRERRENGFDFPTSKDDLRRAAGLVAGKPARHS